jgi:hypothetical protein
MMVGIKNPRQTVSEKDFIRQWNDPQVGSEMRALGFESPEQFGSLFIADGSRLRNWISDGLPLVDNFPKRLSFQDKKSEELVKVYRGFMNENTSCENFMKSESISNIWPEKLRKESEKYFKVRQTINEILSDGSMRNTTPLADINACLHEPLLENYTIWAFGSDQFAQKIISNRKRNRFQNLIDAPEIYEHLVADAARKRDYLLAEKYLHFATNNPRPPYNFENYFTHVVYRMYFLLMAGDKEGAVKVGQEYINLEETEKDKRIKEVKIYWNWLNQLLRSAS